MVNTIKKAFPVKKGEPLSLLKDPINKFIQFEASSGIVLIFSVTVAIGWSNLRTDSYTDFFSTKFGFSFGDFILEKGIILWINDFLMAIFFLLIGLELKREILIGELSSLRNALLPIIAAMGGAIVPAAIYLLFNPPGSENVDGWAIPMATDIAFSLGILYLLGNKIPFNLKIFLTSLAIVDDLTAIIVIAVFYTETIKSSYLMAAGGIIVLLLLMNRLGVDRYMPYVIVGILLWFYLLKSGIHSTLAGVIVALTIPATTKIDLKEFQRLSNELVGELNLITSDEELSAGDISVYQNTVEALETTCKAVEAPLQRLEKLLYFWVLYVIMPIFAVANAGVVLSLDFFELFQDPLVWGIIFGLVLGKPLGIFAFSFFAIRFNIVSMPEGLTKRHLLGVGMLAGIGFTMSTFIASLSFVTPEVLDSAKVAILFASGLAAVLGLVVLLSVDAKNTMSYKNSINQEVSDQSNVPV
ncbi:MAG: Na+/H+ antiporter NhaA [Candidatus Kariarchaeaceae archaeon]|jgi:NhaA family Na+:H+ antiporter